MSGVNEMELPLEVHSSNHRGSQSLRGTGASDPACEFPGHVTLWVVLLNGPQLTASSSLVRPAHCSEGQDLRLSRFNTSIS